MCRETTSVFFAFDDGFDNGTNVIIRIQECGFEVVEHVTLLRLQVSASKPAKHFLDPARRNRLVFVVDVLVD